MPGDLPLSAADADDLVLAGADLHLEPQIRPRYRVARGTETHRLHLVDLAQLRPGRAVGAVTGGSGRMSGSSTCSRLSGTAQISECSTPFTSRHQRTASWLATSRSSLSSGAARSRCAYPHKFSTTPFDSGSPASQKSGLKR